MRTPTAAVFPPRSSLLARSAVLTALLFAALPAAAQSPFPAIHPGSLNGALEEAEERNALVVCILLQENEETNDSFYTDVYRKKAFVTATANTLLVVANDNDHRQKEIEEVDAEGNVTRRSVCARFHTADCNTHKGFSLPVFERFKRGEGDDATLITPFLAILAPDGETHSRMEDVVDLPRILGALSAAKKASGPSISKDQLRALEAHLSAGRKALDAGRLGDTWRCYDAAFAILPMGPLGEAAAEGKALALKITEESLAAAKAQMEAGELEKGWHALTALAASCRETPLGKQVEAQLKETRKDKRWRQEIRQIEKEDEAKALLAEIVALLKEGSERKALSRGKRLLDRFAGTKASARFRSEYRDLVDKIEGGAEPTKQI